MDEVIDPQVRLRLIPYNARLIHARKAKGLNQTELALLTGISVFYISTIETLKVIPSLEVRQEIADALNSSVEYLFPQELLEAIKERTFEKRTAELSGQQLLQLEKAENVKLVMQGNEQIEQIEQSEHDLSLKMELNRILNRLPASQQRIIELRFGLDEGGRSRTFEEVTNMVGGGVTRERIRQIEARTLRYLRHPEIARHLEEFLR